ncbi:transporter [Geothrix limicola]|uniref:Transporter n=1 Tax=Geothrix limicola TaxID=2927978 RepID=A0ABQ5QCE2_9BACT|nr:TolC family protein [Geothrix limicola]GLH72111.1 transporter [Geothrix limicola]
MTRLPILPALLVAFSLVAQDAPKADAPKAAGIKLSLQDAIETSLKNNLQVEIAKQSRISTQAGETLALGSFDWNLGSNLSISHSKSTFEDKQLGLQTASGNTTNDYRSWSLGLNKPFDWGGTFQLNYNPTYNSSTSHYLATSTFPGANVSSSLPYTGTFGASYTQNLLRGFGRDVTGANLIVAKLGSKSADYAFQLSIINLVASTESQYWDVVFAQRNLENKQQALELAQKQLKENQIRVDVGTLAPIEVTSSEASVAQAEQDIIAAEAQLLNAKDALIRALYPGSERPAGLELTDAPTLSHTALKEDEAERMALDRRVELKNARLDLQSKNVLENAANNRLLPQLDLSLGYNGTASNYDTLSPVNKDLTQGKNPGYSIGLQFSMPIQNHAARGSLYQARAARHSSELNLQDQELAIRLQVRQSIRNIEAAEKGVKAAEKTRIFREKDLDAEKKKFENGMSTNFLVLSKLNDLNTAKGNELQAQINYAKGVTALEQAVGNLLEARKLSVK